MPSCAGHFPRVALRLPRSSCPEVAMQSWELVRLKWRRKGVGQQFRATSAKKARRRANCWRRPWRGQLVAASGDLAALAPSCCGPLDCPPPRATAQQLPCGLACFMHDRPAPTTPLWQTRRLLSWSSVPLNLQAAGPSFFQLGDQAGEGPSQRNGQRSLKHESPRRASDTCLLCYMAHTALPGWKASSDCSWAAA